MHAQENFSDLFAPEDAPGEVVTALQGPVWKVLLVDDEPDIHSVLHLALQDVVVEGMPLQLFDAQSAVQARQVLRHHPDIALILLDVVMETEQAGLDLVRYIRRELRNRIVQIVLLTGQPGYAPQRKVVADFEIDGYRLKSELTTDKIFVSVYAALRTHKALRELVAKRLELESMTQILREREGRLRSVVETAPDAIILADEAGVIFDWNDGARKLFGFAREECIGRSFTMLVTAPLRTPALAELYKIRAGKMSEALQGHALEATGLHKNGSEIPIELVLGSWQTAMGRNFSAVVRDISERRRNEANLRLAASVYANSYEGIIVTDAKRVIVDVNPAFTRITGYSREDALGKSPNLLASGRHDANFYAKLFKSLSEQDFWQGEIVNRRKGGEFYTQILSISVIRDSSGLLQHYIGVFSDVTMLKAHEHELYKIAHYDTLTGVPNRRLLSDRMDQAMARATRTGKVMAVCYLDLDGFKQINDEFGHAAGDHMLVEVAERLKTILRKDDTLARLGGDEFVMLLTDLGAPEESRVVLDRVLHEVSAPVFLGNRNVQVSASIGVTIFPADDFDADTLLRHADQAMYLAKENGKNTYHFFDADHDRKVKTQQHYLERLAQALDNKEFVLYYQPMVDLASGDVVGAEALIRWQHPDRGLLAPGEFLHFFEGRNLEISIGQWVIEQVLAQIAAWKVQGLSLRVSANISANHLLTRSFAERLQAALDAQPTVLPGNLELEILETVALADMKLAVETLVRCRKMGVQFALDDFGTGYSSLTYFLKLPVHVLKVDQSFVRGMLDDPNELGIVETVVRLAQAFNRPVIAEGVETLAHGTMLLALGCRLAQGYGIARPMPAAKLIDWVGEWHRQQSWKTTPRLEGKTDLVLAVAENSLRKWTDAVLDVQSNPENEPRMAVDPSNCPFGRWYRGSGFARYGVVSGFQEIGELHGSLHNLANELLENGPDKTRKNLIVQELQNTQHSIVKLLHRIGEHPASD